MPIVVKDFVWKQTDDRLTIQVPLHRIPPTKVDIFTSPRYIKATFEAYFFETLLLNPTDPSRSICTKSPEYLLFDLQKCEPNHWETLEPEHLTKEEKFALKQRLIEEEFEREQERSEDRVKKKAELKRLAVNEQIELDTRTRNKIENIKKAEEKEALGDLNEWQRSVEIKPKKKLSAQKRLSDKKTASEPSTIVPKPRGARSLQILFTPREFPTPSRESKADEENEFLAKQAEARRSAGFVDEDLRPEEKNPHYLLAKGREFERNNNHLGAISAYSFGIKLSPKFVDLYLARSETHLAIGNFNRTVEDCSKALELLKPALPVNLHERAVCLGRRGVALCKLGFLKQGIAELRASLKLEKCDELEKKLDEFKSEFEQVESKNRDVD